MLNIGKTYRGSPATNISKYSIKVRLSMLFNYMIDNSVILKGTSALEERLKTMNEPAKVENYKKSLLVNLNEFYTIHSEKSIMKFKVTAEESRLLDMAISYSLFDEYDFSKVQLNYDLTQLGAIDDVVYKVQKRGV